MGNNEGSGYTDDVLIDETMVDGMWSHSLHHSKHDVILALSTDEKGRSHYELAETSCIGTSVAYFGLSEGVWTVNEVGEVVCSGPLLYRASKGALQIEEFVPFYTVRVHQLCFIKPGTWCNTSHHGIPDDPKKWGTIHLKPYSDRIFCAMQNQRESATSTPRHVTNKILQDSLCRWGSGKFPYICGLTWRKYGLHAYRKAVISVLCAHHPRTGKDSSLLALPGFLLTKIAKFLVF
ncbi:hypothetical protein Pelo_9045 [Pelomyxa schiedti]|nr:hypothetical protein Pelo_9045 [Pelomyxa schiedti]